MSGSMRTAMPQCAAWIDDLRAAFGTGEVDAWIRAGLANGTFFAEEGEHRIGRKPAPVVSVAATVPPLPTKRGRR
jgi:hypothetical protein